MTNLEKAPLDGILVVDFSQYFSGPLATRMMVDNGARVIKIEPSGGEPVRMYGASHADHPETYEPGVSSFFVNFSYGKESLVVDLKDPKELEFIKRIIAKADILVENFRPGVMKKLGLDYETLKSDYPRLIYLSVSGYGQSGPFAERAALDVVIQATSGFMASTGFPGGTPTKAGSCIADNATGIAAYAACMTALFGRERSGHGCHCDIAMQDTMLAIQADQLVDTLATGKAMGMTGNDIQQTHPFGVYECKDNTYLAVCCVGRGHFHALADALECPQWKTDERFQFPVPLVTKYRKEFDAEFYPVLKTRTAKEWGVRLDEVGLPNASLYDFEEIIREPFFRDRNIFIESDNGQKAIGNILKMAPYPDIDKPPHTARLDEHGDAIRREFPA